MCSCGEEYVPEGLYHYQAARLLSADSTKYWELVPDANSTQLVPYTFDVLGVKKTSKTGDTLQFALINSTTSDSTLYGYATLSRYNLLFTDSILFLDDNYWIIRQLTSQKLTVESSAEDQMILVEFLTLP
jgi:hypothetical protein